MNTIDKRIHMGNKQNHFDNGLAQLQSSPEILIEVSFREQKQAYFIAKYINGKLF